MHIRISSFYEYKIFKIVIFMLSRAARQQKVPRAQV